jgi:hypothetical protein
MFIPVRQNASGLTGDVSDGNKDAYLTTVQQIFPLESVNSTVHPVYSTNATLSSNGDGWGEVLSEVNALRVAEGLSDHYYGVVGLDYLQGVAGLAYLAGRAALGVGFLPRGAEIVAHELGHNLNRLHVPCGNPPGVDPDYPYPGGAIGAFGMDVLALSLIGPTRTDVMSYCSRPWISDYTYEGMLAYRAANPLALRGTSVAQRSLLVWGRVERGRLVLEPAFPVRARPVLPAEPGPYTVEGLDAQGTALFSFRFAPEPVADLPNHAGFAFAVPAPVGELATLRLTDGAALVEVRPSRPGPAGEQLAPRLRSWGTDSARMEWNAAAYPLAVVRNRRTGTILSLARGGAFDLPASPPELDVTFSDGVNGVTRRLPAAR